jgi:hypothetical protein
VAPKLEWKITLRGIQDDAWDKDGVAFEIAGSYSNLNHAL